MLKPYPIGLRVICLLLVLIMVAAIPCVVPAAATEDTEQVPADIVVSLVRLYGRAGSQVIGRVQHGSELTVLKDSGKFYKIDLHGMNGYIAKEQVRVTEDGKYFVSCAEGSAETTTLTVEKAEAVLQMQRSIIKLAVKQLGTRYVWGGSRPGGFDCSGLTSYVYNNAAREISRNALIQMSDGLVVAEEDLQPGDLLFYRDTGRWGGIASHVGIYIGDGKMIHADSQGVRVTELSYTYYDKRYIGARRVLISDAPLDPTETITEENWWETPVNQTGAFFTPQGNPYCKIPQNPL